MRITGVETGSDRYNALLDQYRGALAQFQLGQQQQVAISGQRQYKASRVMPGARMTYQNNEGQETITLELTTSGGGAEHQVTRSEYWDWALVELVIPGMAETRFEMSAFLTKPVAGKTVFAVNNWNFNSSDNILRYADVAWDKQLGATNEATDLVASLLVDLRKFQHEGVLSIDLRGFMYPFTSYGLPEDPSWPFTFTSSARKARWGRDASPYTSPVTVSQVTRGFAAVKIDDDGDPRTVGALLRSFPELAAEPYVVTATWQNDGQWPAAPFWDRFDHPGAWWNDSWLSPQSSDPNDFTSNFAAVYSDALAYWDGASFYRKTETRQGVSGFKPDGTAWTSNVITQTNDNGLGSHTSWNITMYDYIEYFIPSCNTYPTKDAQFRVTFFKGNAIDASSFWHSAGLGYFKWEIASKYPARPHQSTLPDTATVVGQDYPADDSLANHFGQPMLGTLVINPNKASGGFKFKRA